MSILRQIEIEDRPWSLLAQIANSAATLEGLITAAADGTVLARLRIVNRAATTKKYRIAYIPLGVTPGPEHYLEYDASLAANTSVVVQLGIVMVMDDELHVWAESADLSMSLFGAEA